MATEISKAPVTEEELASAAIAPRVTAKAVEEAIAFEHYFTAYEGVLGERFVRGAGESDKGEGKIPKTLQLMTFCVLTLQNGYTVVGQSACAAMENFNADLRKRLAREHAMNQIWPLLGFNLRTRLAALKQFSQGNQELDEALTRLTAASLGNEFALRSADYNALLGYFDTTQPEVSAD